jgi:2-haloacid dehalogenase
MGGAGDSPATGVDVMIFDVVETLFSLEAVRERLDEAGAGDGALELWFARFLRDGFALAASGTYRGFRDVAASSLAGVLRSRDVDPQPELVEQVLGGLAELSPHPDARPALELARARGVRVLTLANGSAAATQSLLKRAGLGQLVERCLSVEETRAWKPRPEPYAAACRAAAVAPSGAALVAVHAWDIHGAAAAGLRTGWCSRLEGEFAPVFTAPTVRGATLVEVVDQLARGARATG